MEIQNSKPETAARRALREDALLGAAAPFVDSRGIFGPAVLPLTPWSELLLSRHGNAFFTGGIPTVADVLQFLWFCSPEFWHLKHTPDGSPRRAYCALYHRYRFWLFRLRWRRAVSRRLPATYSLPATRYSLLPTGTRGPTLRILHAIRAHIAEAIAEPLPAPPRKVGAPPPESAVAHHHELALAEVMCRRLLGYTRVEFWHTPYAHTRQLLAIVLEQRPQQPGVPKFNPAVDRETGARLRARHQEYLNRMGRN